jgi:GNAT superfamily N-acetyltransferase
MYYDVVEQEYPQFAMVAYELHRPDVPVARSFAVPFLFAGESGRDRLPDDGWDGVIRWGWLDRAMGRRPTHVSALEIAIAPERRGEGLAAVMLSAMRANVARLGFSDLFAPVRPSGKTREPNTPMAEYVGRTRLDGLPVDPWLRVHVRAGGRIL